MMALTCREIATKSALTVFFKGLTFAAFSGRPFAEIKKQQ